MSVEQSETVPVACTLGASDFKSRVAWIADLNRRALRSQRRDDLRLELTYASEARDAVLDMVRGEQECCAFLNFEVHDEPGAVRVVIQAPERAREAPKPLSAPSQPSPPVGAGSSRCGAA